MRYWITALLIVILPLCLGVVIKNKKGGPGGAVTAGGAGADSVKSMFYYEINEVDITDTADGFTGCDIASQFGFTHIDRTLSGCRVPAGVQQRIHQFGGYVISDSTPISECDICVAVDGVDEAATCLLFGVAGLDTEGDSDVNVIGSPDWEPPGSEITFTISDNSDDCENGAADLSRIAIWMQIETGLVP